MARHRPQLVAAAAASLALAGCFWPAPGAEPGRSAYNAAETDITPATVAGLHVVWTGTGDGASMGPPVVSTAGVHAADSTALYAFAPGDGARLWAQPVDPPGIATIGPAVIDGNRVVVGFGFGNLGGHWTTTALDTATGADLGTLGPAANQGLVDGLRGTTLLTRSIAFGSGTPVVTRIGVTDLAVAGSGWSAPITVQSAGPAPGAATLGTSRVLQAGPGPMLPGGTLGNGVRSFAVATAPATCPPPAPSGFACPQWSTALPGADVTSPVLGPGETTLYVATDVGTVHAVDTATGAVAWTAPVTGAGAAPPALAQGALYVPTAGGLVVLDAATGAVRFTAATGGPVEVQPAVAGGVVYAGADDGTVRAFAAAGCGAATCAPLWSAPTGSAITGAPAVNQGRLYVGTADSRVVAYGLSSSR
jgi:outer membrane protein assembly factor BamB